MSTDLLQRPDPASPATVEISSGTPLAEALSRAARVSQVTIHFSSFKDGRGFSLASALREHGFAGVLLATGDLLPDQADMLRRVGFDVIAPERAADSPRWTRAGYSHSYQPSARGEEPAYRQRALAARKAKTEALNAEFGDALPERILSAAVDAFGGRIAQLSSFGAEAGVGLALLAKVAPTTPVLFIDTQRHFAQTLSYRDTLQARLGLSNIVVIEPDAKEALCEDGDARLFQRDAAACCDLRKVRPLARTLDAYDAVITGRKRYHGGERASLQAFEFDGERVKVNPLVNLTPQEVSARFRALDLPVHPLVAEGYPSIGCWPCTAPAANAGAREGRWAGAERNECGIFDPARVRRAARSGYRLI